MTADDNIFAPMDERPMSYERLVEDIRKRVRGACPEMPEVAFFDLTARMAEIEMKYRMRAAFLALDVSGLSPDGPPIEQKQT